KSTQSSGDGGSLPPRQPPRDDLRHAVAAHRDAVEDVGGLHRALLMRDHDELGAAGEAAEKLDEAADVRVVERGLDLVEQVERAGPGEEQREQERDRAERLLAAGEEREAGHALAGRPELDLDPRLAAVLELGQAQATLAAGKERRGDLGEVPLDGCERLLESSLDGLGELAPELLEPGQAALEVLALQSEVGQARLLVLVFLLRERVHVPEQLAAAVEARELLGEFRPLALRRLRAGLVEAATGVAELRLEARPLDLEGGGCVRGLHRLPPQLCLDRPEPPELGCKLARTRRSLLGGRAQRRVEVAGARHGRVE